MKSGNEGALLEYRAVTIVKPSSLGDIVHALPAVAALREAMPGARFRWLANTEWVPLIDGSPLVDEVIAFPRKQFRGLAGAGRFVKWLRAWRQGVCEEPELVLDLQGLLRSGVISRMRGGAWVVGMSDAREGARWFHQQRVEVDPGGHAVDRCLAVPRALGVMIPEQVRFPLAEGSRPEGWPDDEDVVVVHPFSRGEGKSLSKEALEALVAGLRPVRVVVVGAAPGAAGRWLGPVTDLTSRTTLGELVWCLRRASWVVSVDSGPMHMAAAVNSNTLGLHTWTDPRKVGPYPKETWVWKGGRIAHRQDLSAVECARENAVSAADAGVVARWVRERMGR
jgi:heptosyltransferase-1